MRRQRAAALDGTPDPGAPAELLARLGGQDPAELPAAAMPAPEPDAPARAPDEAGLLPTLAAVTRDVAPTLAARLVPGDAVSGTLATELAELARASGAGRLAALFTTLAATEGAAALPLLGEVCRRLEALAAVTGTEAGADALRQAVAAQAGDGGLPSRLADLAAGLASGAADQAALLARQAREAALVADALGLPALRTLLLLVEDVWDRSVEPDAAAMIAEEGPALADRLRAAAAGGPATLAEPPGETAMAAAPPGVPEEFAAALGREGRARLAEAQAAGSVLYRARISPVDTPEREAELLAWLAGQGATALASRALPGGEGMLELLVAAPADARALEASRARFDPQGRVIAPLVPAGPGTEAGRAAPATLRVRQETVDGIIALQADLRAAAMALSGAAEQEAGRGIAVALAEMARGLPPGTARQLGLLTERVRRLLTELQEHGTRMSLALRRLDDAMLELRVTPLAGLLGRMPRVARAAALPSGKQVEVVLEGGEVSIDRSLIEQLADPLQHLVRNAVDHGVEDEARRVAAGKPPRATIRIAAERHGADRVRITVSDDGAGIDRDAVLRTAMSRGLVRPAEAEAMDDAAVHALLFRPGFSTRESVSETSGRGVGLDVVEDALNRSGGRLAVSSLPGEGTAFMLDLPLSAAIAPVLLVEAGGHLYALPSARVEGVLQEGSRDDAARPPVIVSLEAALGLAPASEAASIVVLRGSAGRALGLSVARVARQADLLLRPLHPSLATLPCIGGVGVLGTGEPVVVLEPDGFLVD